MNGHLPIAIVGMGGVFPGAMDCAQLWEHVAAGRSMSREVPAGRWAISMADAYAEKLAADKVYSKRGCFVDDFVCDVEGLKISRAELDRLDPMFHLLLHAGRAAWRDAVTEGVDRKRVGVIIGNIALPTESVSALSEEVLGPLFERALVGEKTKDERRTTKVGAGTDPLNRYVAGLAGGDIGGQALGVGWGRVLLWMRLVRVPCMR